MTAAEVATTHMAIAAAAAVKPASSMLMIVTAAGLVSLELVRRESPIFGREVLQVF